MTDRPDHDAPTSDEAFPRGSEAETTELIRQALEARDYADALEGRGSEIGPYKLIANLGEGAVRDAYGSLPASHRPSSVLRARWQLVDSLSSAPAAPKRRGKPVGCGFVSRRRNVRGG
jgi:hypothetical protein